MNQNLHRTRPRLAHRIVTGIATLMLLLCQTAAAVLAYAATPAMPVARAASQTADAASPCHHAVQQDESSTPAHDCAHQCPSRDASFETAKADIPPAPTSVLMIVAAGPAITGAAAAQPHRFIVASATPPPLIRVHCRLLI